MENLNLILTIQSQYNQFTKTEKKVADYCLNNRDTVPFLSISELADSSGVGDATVYRFCRTLGLDGYQEFRMKFSLAQGNARIESALYKSVTETEDSLTTISKNILNSHISSLEKTYELLDMKLLQKTVDAFENADRILFFGISDSLIMAEEAYTKFLRITPKVVFISDPHMQLVSASMTSKKDVVFIVSYSGSTPENVSTAKSAHDNGATVICLTHYKKSPITPFCDLVLLCAGEEGPLDAGSMATRLSQLYIIDILYQYYYERNHSEASLNHKKALEAIVNRLG